MDENTRDLLIRTLREGVSNALGAAEALSPLVREQGDEADRFHLAILSQALYREMRTILHLELTREEEPDFRPRTLELVKLFNAICRQMVFFAASLEVAFLWENTAGDPLVFADPALLEPALLNLLSNAFRNAGKGGSVSCRMARRGEAVLITVSDNGPGLQAGSEVPESLLTSPVSGLGLGLQAARRIAELHRGALVLEDREEEGVRAVLRLPLQHKGDPVVEGPKLDYLLTGGFDPALIEFSGLLPSEVFSPEDLD